MWEKVIELIIVLIPAAATVATTALPLRRRMKDIEKLSIRSDIRCETIMYTQRGYLYDSEWIEYDKLCNMYWERNGNGPSHSWHRQVEQLERRPDLV